MVTPIIKIFDAVLSHQPLEGFDVRNAFAYAEDHKQMFPYDGKFDKPCVSVESIEMLKVRFKPLVSDQIQQTGNKRAVFPFVNREDVIECSLSPQPDKDVVAEDEFVTDRNHVPRDAVVPRGYSLA